jgi:glycosyltransferase involved in cell wall biosynthesis
MTTIPATPPCALREPGERRRLRVLTWHVHGNYLYYLSHMPHDFCLAVLPGHPPGHAGRVGSLPWGPNVIEVDARRLAEERFDCVLYQSREHFERDRVQRLSPAQRALPSIYLEHDPPQQHPTATRHPAADGSVHLVHVTHFNALMWDNGDAPVSVIEHGVVLPPGVAYRGERAEGIVVVNDLGRRGRRLGLDLYLQARRQVPLALVGMGSAELGGAGEVANVELAAAIAPYRFFFHPVRYTSLGLAVVEAMMLGMPVVGFATTELPSVIRSGVDGFVDLRLARLVDAMRALQDDPALARRWGEAARRTALERFHIDRFVADWDRLLCRVAGGGAQEHAR